MFTKRSRNKNLRQKTNEDIEEEDAPVKIVKKQKNELTDQKKEAEENLSQIHYKPSGSSFSSVSKENATATNDYDPEIKKLSSDSKQANAGSAELYVGSSAYTKFGDGKYVGPIRIANNIRSTSRFDYAPDICKDYKETGICGFGDSCKFVHDRGDYKSGWELDLEYENQLKEQKEGKAGYDENEFLIKEEENMQSDCPICNLPLKNPSENDSGNNQESVEIIVKSQTCEHLFHQKCAIVYLNSSASKKPKKNAGEIKGLASVLSKCPVCKSPFGTFVNYST